MVYRPLLRPARNSLQGRHGFPCGRTREGSRPQHAVSARRGQNASRGRGGARVPAGRPGRPVPGIGTTDGSEPPSGPVRRSAARPGSIWSACWQDPAAGAGAPNRAQGRQAPHSPSRRLLPASRAERPSCLGDGVTIQPGAPGKPGRGPAPQNRLLPRTGETSAGPEGLPVRVKGRGSSLLPARSTGCVCGRDLHGEEPQNAQLRNLRRQAV